MLIRKALLVSLNKPKTDLKQNCKHTTTQSPQLLYSDELKYDSVFSKIIQNYKFISRFLYSDELKYDSVFSKIIQNYKFISRFLRLTFTSIIHLMSYRKSLLPDLQQKT